jgi:hypothetical protein
MGHEANIWGTGKAVSIASTVESALEYLPRHGGEIIEQVQMVSGRVFRRRDGWIIELCDKFGENARVHLSKYGTSVTAQAEIALVYKAGEEEPTLDELEAARLRDEAARKAQEVTALDAELDELLARITAEYADAPHIEFTAAE